MDERRRQHRSCSRELVLPGRRFAIVGILDPDAKNSSFDRYVTVWYMHVTRHEMLTPGAPPFTQPPPSSSDSPTPSQV